MKRSLILLSAFFAIRVQFALAQSAADVQQGIRDAIADYWGDYLPNQPVHVHRVYDISPFGGDPFRTPQLSLSQRVVAVSVSLEGPTSNQSIQLTPSRTAFTFSHD